MRVKEVLQVKIYEVRLINVKSYEDAVLSFQPGINFISGINGAGKTTVIESIGYALFNYNPYGLKQLLREGAKSGEIQVVIEAQDERLYRIIRRFTAKSSTKWEVWDEESDTLLDDLHGHNDVTLWIKQNIGVDEDDNLQDLFQQVIAVQQGLFTIPFLDTPAERKKTFDAVLKVEGYRQAFERMQPIQRFFAFEKEHLEESIDTLNRVLADLPDVEERIKQEKARLKANEKIFMEQGTKLKEVNTSLEHMRELKETLDSLTQSIALYEAQINGTQNQISALTSDLKDAEQARQITKKHAPAFERYNQLQGELNRLDSEMKDKRKLETQVVQLDKTISTHRAALQTEVRSIKEDKVRLEAQLKELLIKEEGKEQEKAYWKGIIKKTSSWTKVSKPWSSILTSLEEWIRRHHSSIDQAVQLRQRAADLEREIEDLKEDTKDLAKWEQLERELAADLQIDKVRQMQAQKQAEMEALLRNQDYLMKGLCPIIQESCPSEEAAGGLDEFFHEQRAELKKVLEILEQQVHEQEQIESQLEKVKGRIQLARNQRDVLRDKREKSADHLRQTVKTIQSIDWSGLDHYLKEFAAVPDLFHDSVEKVQKELDQWELGSQNSLDEQPVESVREYPVLLETSLSSLTQWLSDWSSWVSHLHLVMDGWNQNFRAFDNWLTQIHHGISSKLSRVEVELESIGNQKKEVQDQQHELGDRAKRLSTETAQLHAEEEVLEGLREKLREYVNLDSQLSAVKSEMDSLRHGFNLYQENIKLARRYDTIGQKLAELNKQVRDLMGKQQGEIEKEQSLRKQYDPKEHQVLDESVQKLKEAIQSTSFEMEKSKERLQDLFVEYDRLMEWKAEWQAKTEELNQIKMAGELTQALRGILRDAADPIAHQFRQYISHLATDIYRQVSNENVRVQWAGEYEVQLVDHQGGAERIRVFKQLSGGEQMTAALAIRLAMMRLFSRVGVGFFDEPTSNLDGERRQSLALAIQSATEGFEQLFVISHDDTFDSVTENVIALQKDQGVGTIVN